MARSEKLLIIVATYNEIDCLPRLIHQIDEVLPKADILVIDDGSPDGTGNWCEQAAEKYPQMTTIHREGKLGLGSAAVVGFKHALDGDYDLVATMDADLSHSPQSLVEMVKLIRRPANKSVEVVLGSRYIEGGGTEDWPLSRRVASRTVNGFARFMLGLKTKDNSGAFRVYRFSALKKLDLAKLKSSDFAYLEEILWRLSKADVKMIEHPIIFKNREEGSSKTNPMLGLKVFWQITLMGLGRWN